MSENVPTPIYLDHHASTPVDQQVLEAMQPYHTEHYGNPANDTHQAGRDAKTGVETAATQVADAIGAPSTKNIIFTSGATESDNLAIRGPVEHALQQGETPHIITAVTEHEAVLEPCEVFEADGVDITYLPVDEHGRVDPDDVRAAVQEETLLISIMAANNEIGTVAPLAEIGEIADEHDIYFHTDAVQALGYLELDVEDLGIDLMSISGHKIYGPKGVGALYVRRPHPKNDITPLIRGGGHQSGLRSGTLNVPGIVGLGKAVDLAVSNQDDRVAHVETLRDRLWDQLTDRLDDLALNGHPDHRLPHNLNVSFRGVSNYLLTRELNQHGIIAAAGAACSTAEDGGTTTVETSHVLEAITDDEERLESAVRFGLGKDTTADEIDYVADTIADIVPKKRRVQL
ncbi:cysteine desulfurase family protein [Haloterrigena alkaliphila]|uniref:cysteine desulfurase n=1 Tax=Haloterrigena alkaliphila TaxID=2816475 RepID=A0A8A2VLA6_9EURY|nr:cysteine desulfurase family protein [Haloterrigena alkaliphila]QSX01103.1 cysteine desulfurase [Haloterrigena alkaliphila]